MRQLKLRSRHLTPPYPFSKVSQLGHDVGELLDLRRTFGKKPIQNVRIGVFRYLQRHRLRLGQFKFRQQRRLLVGQ